MELHDPSKKFKCAGTLSDGTPWGCNKEFARKDALSRHFKSQQVPSPPASSDVNFCRDDHVLMQFCVKDEHWRICMNNKASQWLLSVETHRMECMKIRNTCLGVVFERGKFISMMDGVLFLLRISCVWVIFLGRSGLFF